MMLELNTADGEVGELKVDTEQRWLWGSRNSWRKRSGQHSKGVTLIATVAIRMVYDPRRISSSIAPARREELCALLPVWYHYHRLWTTEVSYILGTIERVT